MISTTTAINETEKRLLTVRQQIEQLKLANKVQRDRLEQNKNSDAGNFSPNSRYNRGGSFNNNALLIENETNESVVEQPSKSDCIDFKSKVQESNPENITVRNFVKRRYLRKGEGGIAYSTRKTRAGRVTLSADVAKKIKPVTNNRVKYVESDDNQELSPCRREISPLKAFESLEGHSMIAQLMENSIKSTPIKPSSDEYCVVQPESLFAHNVYGERDIFGIRTLDIINEEQSRDGSTVEKIQTVVNDASNGDNKNGYFSDETCSDDDSECCSQCSCQENNYTSKSISLITEETTTVFSPAKSESKRTVQFIRQDDIQFDRNIQNKEEENLKYFLQTRLRELETEIDAFRSENERLTKLRTEYEQEYSKFCEEKTQLLTKIRAEQLQGLRNIEIEKKKLQRDKNEFDKYVKVKNSRCTKEEKEEIRLLKEEIEFLNEKMKKKETRSAAAQASIRTELKRLKDRNEQLEQRVKELKEKSEKANAAPPILSKNRKSVYSAWRNAKSKNTDLLKQPSNESDILNNLEFVDTPYIDRIRSYAENYEIRRSPSSIDQLRKSICVNSFVNDANAAEESINDVANAVETTRNSIVAQVRNTDDASCEKSFPDGRKEIWYPNGNVKTITPDGELIKTIYYNGDVKEVLTKDQIVKYFYAESKVWRSEYKDGLEIIEFPSGQIEKHYPDGSVDITDPNGNTYHKSSNDEEKWTYNDGRIIMKNKAKNEETIIFPNGQIEIDTVEYKRRKYPDGNIKTIYKLDGRQETRYWNGRVRLKTKDGRLISDTDVT